MEKDELGKDHLTKGLIGKRPIWQEDQVVNGQIGKTKYYSLIAFDERVTFWLQRVQSLPCACAYVALFARRLAYNHYAIAHAYNAANAHAQGSDRPR